MNEDKLIDWLNSETIRNQIYHDHKENMAWVATAIYITGMIALGIQFNYIVDFNDKLIALILAVIATVSSLWFVYWQFDRRRIAHQRIKGLIQTVIHLSKKHFDLDWTVENEHLYPTFIQQYIKIKHRMKDDPWQSAIISLSAMLVALTIFSVLIIG